MSASTTRADNPKPVNVYIKYRIWVGGGSEIGGFTSSFPAAAATAGSARGHAAASASWHASSSTPTWLLRGAYCYDDYYYGYYSAAPSAPSRTPAATGCRRAFAAAASYATRTGTAVSGHASSSAASTARHGL